MKKSWKKKWLEALRSGEYKQGRSYLRNDDGKEAFCCLGVLCDLPSNTRWDGENSLGKRGLVLGYEGELTLDGLEKFGLDHLTCCTLVEMNDDKGASFKKIAEYIEKNL